MEFNLWRLAYWLTAGKTRESSSADLSTMVAAPTATETMNEEWIHLSVCLVVTSNAKQSFALVEFVSDNGLEVP